MKIILIALCAMFYMCSCVNTPANIKVKLASSGVMTYAKPTPAQTNLFTMGDSVWINASYHTIYDMNISGTEIGVVISEQDGVSRPSDAFLILIYIFAIIGLIFLLMIFGNAIFD